MYYFVVSLNLRASGECGGAQVVMKNAVRLHCHSAPNAGSETDCGLPTDIAPPATASTTAQIAIIVQMVLIADAPISTQELYASPAPFFVN